MCIILLSFIFGVMIGSVAGFFGGKVDQVMMRIIDIFMAVPTIFMAMTIITVLGDGVKNIIIAFVVCNIPSYSRIVRSSTMTLRNMEYVEAAECYGANKFHIILKHIIPNGIGPVIVTATISLGVAILSISSLGFLGLGHNGADPGMGHAARRQQELHQILPVSRHPSRRGNHPNSHVRQLHRRTVCATRLTRR